MKILVLVNKEKNDYFPIKECEEFLSAYYKSENILHRVIRKIILKFNLPFKKALFSHWYSSANKADTIILFDTGNLYYILKWLTSEFKNKRIIVWYWNSIKDSVNPMLLKDIKDIEIWSFDKSDCLKFGFKYNTQFVFWENMNRDIINMKRTQDVFYVGSDKNRAVILKDLKYCFDKEGISYFFHLIKFKKNNNKSEFKYYKPLKYYKVIENVKKSKAIIDLVAEWQDGITLRPLEAFFLKKKLITNMKNIVKYDFYNSNNIFILGVDDFNKIREFINSPFDDKDYNRIVEKYCFRGWLKRFYDKKEEGNK